MNLWALSDLHLGFSVDKPMDKFGGHWERHAERIAENWLRLVSPADSVVVAGDISWGLDLKEAASDLRFLDQLPGQKYLGRGNHDYWWTSLQKMEAFCLAEGLHSLHFVRNRAYRLLLEEGPTVLFGTRAWISPGNPEWKAADAKLYQRELLRLQLNIKAAQDLFQEGDSLLALLHYPPLGSNGEASGFSEQLEAAGVGLCLYGHAHGESGRKQKEWLRAGLRYLNTACDVLNFEPLGPLRVNASNL